MDIFLILVLGLSIGSFMNVCIYRIAREESIVFPASHCTSCGYQLGYRDLVPIISYITLRGKCRNCNERISIRYLLVEIINGLLYILMYFKFGFTLELIKFYLFTSLIVVIAFIDIETKYVYKCTINFGLVSGILFCILKFIRGNSIPRDNILGAFIGFGITGFPALCILLFFFFHKKQSCPAEYRSGFPPADNRSDSSFRTGTSSVAGRKGAFSPTGMRPHFCRNKQKTGVHTEIQAPQ